MPVERSAGAVVFRKTKQGVEYLLIQHAPDEGHYPLPRRPEGHWDFSKGHIEKGETTLDAVRREVAEETGIRRITFVPGFKDTIRYFVVVRGEKRLKFAAFFLAQTKEKKIALSYEHQDHAWLPYKEAYKKLTYANAKQTLKKAELFLAEHEVRLP